MNKEKQLYTCDHAEKCPNKICSLKRPHLLSQYQGPPFYCPWVTNTIHHIPVPDVESEPPPDYHISYELFHAKVQGMGWFEWACVTETARESMKGDIWHKYITPFGCVQVHEHDGMVVWVDDFPNK